MNDKLSKFWEPASTVLPALTTNYINNIGNFYGTYLIAKDGLIPLAAYNAAFALQSVGVTPCSTTVGYFLNRTDVSLDDKNRLYQKLDYARMHIRNLKRSWLGSVVLSLLSVNIVVWGTVLSASLSKNSEISEQLKDYVKWYLPGLLPQLLLNSNRQFMVAMNKPWISTLFNLLYQGLDAGLSYCFVNGTWKFPRGLGGLALANTISITISLLAFLGYLYINYLRHYPEKYIVGILGDKQYVFYADLELKQFGQLKGLTLAANESLINAFKQDDNYNSPIISDSFEEVANNSQAAFVLWHSDSASPNAILFDRHFGGEKKHVYHIMRYLNSEHQSEYRLLIRKHNVFFEVLSKINDYYSYGLRIAVDQGFLYYKSLLLNIVGINQQAMQEACFQYIALLGNPVMYGFKDTADKLVDRAKKTSETAAKQRAYQMVIAVSLALAFVLAFPLLFYRPALNLFLEGEDKNNDQLLNLGLHLMLVNFPGVIFNGIRDVSVAALSSFGNKTIPWLLIGVAILIGFPLAYLLGLPASMDAIGVMLSRTIVMAIGAALALAVLSRYEPKNVISNRELLSESPQNKEPGFFAKCAACLPFFKRKNTAVATEQNRLAEDSYLLKVSP